MMLLTRYSFPTFEEIQRQFDQAFDEITQTKTVTDWTPAVQLEETPEQYIVRAVIPNLDKNELDIEVAKNGIAISGKTLETELPEGHKITYSEFPVGQFRRVVSLPEAIVQTEVKAEYTDGILTVTLPKAPEVIHRVVKVNLNSESQS
ncbi:16.6 kDa small heat shock protein molecular chaperone [Planktothrix serta PCC 8927]|uniref:16.6 kDa small heat shock protein molecular chaperone n=1 Tax=Planktothrix serta PCC 8927 TaxID=671068 RepID=A0A7Z9BUG3_9CYAN|nr:Hsp20/alpha crystallin family protein [Planktothrix serta]VXD22937.1 16.6 kDa small heat shock protein molecular chaperone [Planktothrix serta PCC 8927]